MTQQLALDLANPADAALIRKVFRVISDHAGRENAIALHRVARAVDASPRDVQEAVKVLVEGQAQPIGTAWSKPFGYYLIVSEAELVKNFRQFMRRGISNLKHARAYNKASVVGPIVGQLEMEIQEDQR